MAQIRKTAVAMKAGSYNQNSSFQLEALKPALDMLPDLNTCTGLTKRTNNVDTPLMLCAVIQGKQEPCA